MLKTTGSTSRGSARMIVRVVMSRETRVLCTSFAFSILFLQPTTYRGPLEALTITAERRAVAVARRHIARGVLAQERLRGGGGGTSRGVLVRRRTSLLVELPQHLADDLADTLQRLQVILRFVVLLLHDLHLRSHCQREGRTRLELGALHRGYTFQRRHSLFRTFASASLCCRSTLR